MNEFNDYPYVHHIDNPTHSEYHVQVWGVDERGNPSFKSNQYDYYILSSVTINEFSEIENVLLSAMEKYGNLKFQEITRQNTDDAMEIVEAISSVNPTIIYQVYKKSDQPTGSGKFESRDIMYTALHNLVSKIERTSDADLILVLVDHSHFLDYPDYQRLSTERTKVLPANDKYLPILEIADSTAGSLGKYVSPVKPDKRYYELLKQHVKGVVPNENTQFRNGLTHNNISKNENKKVSVKKSKTILQRLRDYRLRRNESATGKRRFKRLELQDYAVILQHGQDLNITSKPKGEKIRCSERSRRRDGARSTLRAPSSTTRVR